jgi:hypothetical protein
MIGKYGGPLILAAVLVNSTCVAPVVESYVSSVKVTEQGVDGEIVTETLA